MQHEFIDKIRQNGEEKATMKSEHIIQKLKDLKYKKPCTDCPFLEGSGSLCCVMDVLVPWIESMEENPDE